MDKRNQLIVWQFIRGDLPVAKFEKWLYGSKEFETSAGEDFYVEAASSDFQSAAEVRGLKQKLDEFMREKFPLACECLSLPNLAVLDMGSDQQQRTWQTLKEVVTFGQSRWWLSLFHCKGCGEYWLVAQEPRQNDIYCLIRLSGVQATRIIEFAEWPKHFETWEELLAIGRDNGRAVRFIDPLSQSLVWSVDDLVEARPSITNAEIASLLNIDVLVVNQIRRHGL